MHDQYTYFIDAIDELETILLNRWNGCNVIVCVCVCGLRAHEYNHWNLLAY